MTKTELFIQLAQPDLQGKSRWVRTTEFTGAYEKLKLGNGGDFLRRGSPLDKKYIIETDTSITPGNRIDAIRLNGFNREKTFSQQIRSDIKEALRCQRCVMLGVRGGSVNLSIEIDHKDGRKQDARVSDPATQRIDDFQPLCKAANDAKRQICKECALNNKRWDARNIKGNPYSFYEGDENYDARIGCVGCYQYDPVMYRKVCAKRICEEAVENTSQFIMRKLYPEDIP